MDTKRIDNAFLKDRPPTATEIIRRQKGGGIDVANQNHYTKDKIQPIEYIVANKMDYCEANVVKYVSRHEWKNGVVDINKAIRYLEIIKETKYADHDPRTKPHTDVGTVHHQSTPEDRPDERGNSELQDEGGC